MTNDSPSLDTKDEPHETDLDLILARREFLKNTASYGASAFVSATSLNAASALADDQPPTAFKPVSASTNDTVVLPEGYEYSILIRWGDPIYSNGPEFDPETLGSAASQAISVGDNNDGMDTFTVGTRTILVFNNEFTNLEIMFSNRASRSPETNDDVDKGKYAHGLTIVEIKETNKGWKIVKDSEFNRRITPNTEFSVVGPAVGSDLIKTTNDPLGKKILGTFNNCGNGKTPWGTYLACEENINGYFSSNLNEKFTQNRYEKRYGIAKNGQDWGYKWAQTDTRFDVSIEPNEPNRHGWIVEIDPTGERKPKKLTALGRFKHENAELVISTSGRVIVYMGDDERGEFLYKFVSKAKYEAQGNNSDLLHEGELYVAKFYDDGSGKWISLSDANLSKEETVVYARIAASNVGGTTMDRPEWVAVNPHKAEAYVSLTNNKYRGEKPSHPLNMANPRRKNPYGHILRWTPKNKDHAENNFYWDIFVLAGNPYEHSDLYGGSWNINANNMFNSPDGLKFDSRGNLWIQTDGDYSNKDEFAGMGNNQMLMADPGTAKIHRFLVGPKECEITGLTWSPDKRTMFVGIQHPGQKGGSNWPDGKNSVPRSAIIAVKRNDGKAIG